MECCTFFLRYVIFGQSHSRMCVFRSCPNPFIMISRSFRFKTLKNSGKIPMGIVDTTNTSWSTQKVLKCKKIMFLYYYKYKHVKIIRTNSIVSLKYEENPISGKSIISSWSTVVPDKIFYGSGSPRMGLYRYAFGLKIHRVQRKKSLF